MCLNDVEPFSRHRAPSVSFASLHLKDSRRNSERKRLTGLLRKLSEIFSHSASGIIILKSCSPAAASFASACAK